MCSTRIPLCHIIAGAARRGAGAVHGGLAAGAAIFRIVRRRPQSGAGAKPGIAAIDRGIEQFRQRRPDRLHVGPMRLRFRSFDRLFGRIWFLRHGANMGLLRLT
jgi:hypothetical protein